MSTTSSATPTSMPIGSIASTPSNTVTAGAANGMCVYYNIIIYTTMSEKISLICNSNFMTFKLTV